MVIRLPSCPHARLFYESLQVSGIAMPDSVNCPSAQPNQNGSVVIGVIGTQDGRAQASLLPQLVPLSSVGHLIPDAIPVTEVLRLAAPCAERQCGHFKNHRCTLASRIVARLPAVIDRLSQCALRPSCRWWHQEGPAACHRCPQIVTEPFQTSDLMRDIAIPPVTHEATRTATKGESDYVVS
jgi:hypothetical protein